MKNKLHLKQKEEYCIACHKPRSEWGPNCTSYSKPPKTQDPKQEWCSKHQLNHGNKYPSCNPKQSPDIRKDAICTEHNIQGCTLKHKGFNKKAFLKSAKALQSPESWEEEFEKRFGGRLTFLQERFYYWNKEFYNEMKVFISKELIKAKREERKIIVKKFIKFLSSGGAPDKESILRFLDSLLK